MRAAAVIAVSALTLAACGAEPEKAAPPVEAAAPATPAVAASPATPVALTDADLRRVCQAGVAEIHGQGVADIQIDGLTGRVVNASWRAPIDGGRRRAQGRVDGDLVTWKPVGAYEAGENRWMNQAGDPVTRFVLDGETVTINQTLPDGSSTLEAQSATSDEEAGR